jgi:hypothetical protein
MFSVAEEEAVFREQKLGLWNGTGGIVNSEGTEEFQRVADAAARESGPFTLSLPPMSLVSVERAAVARTSTKAQVVSVRRASAREPRPARRHDDPQVVPEHYLHVHLSPLRGLVLRSDHAAVEVCGLAAPVDVSTAHGSVFVLDSSGPVDVEARDGGSVMWSGSGGAVRIRADTGMFVRLLAANFDGQIRGEAVGNVFVFVPASLNGSLTLDVAGNRSVSIHAVGGPRTSEVVHGARRVTKVGAGRHVASLTSLAGDIDVYWGRPLTVNL